MADERARHTLADVFDPRTNSVNALRLVLAATVLVSHAIKLHGGRGPIEALTGSDVDAGTMAVDGFFALSGFLIVGSYLGSPSTGRYLWRRALRILPGFYVCLLVTAFVLLPLARLLEFGTLSGFPLTGESSALGYLVDNSALLIRQFEVRGLMGGQPVNGSLYTLFYEFLCYLGVAALGVAGLLHRRRVVLLVAVLLWLVVVVDALTGGQVTDRSTTIDIAARFGLMFLAGAVLSRYAPMVPVRRWAGGVAVALVAVALGVAVLVPADVSGTAYAALAAAPVAYLVLLAGSSRVLHGLGSRRDLSYGLYVYAWPVGVLVLLAGAERWPLVLYVPVAAAATLLLAWASWSWVEEPALRLKSWTPTRRRRPVPAGGAPDADEHHRIRPPG